MRRQNSLTIYLTSFACFLILIGMLLLFSGMAQAMNFHQYGLIEGNENSTNQIVAVDTGFPNTRIVFDHGPDSAVDVDYQLLERGDWISGGTATLNSTVNESNLVIDINSEGISDLRFVGSGAFNATIFQYESGMPAKHWQ